MTEEAWFLIVNPQAGGGKGLKKKASIIAALQHAGLSHFVYETKCPGDASTSVEEAVSKGYRRFVVAGGDGTLNEVANGILNQKYVPSDQLLLAQIPVGTGNDWRRSWNIPNSIEGSVALLKNPKSAKQDVASITFQANGKEEKLWFMNVAGCGFDAEVTLSANAAKTKGKSGFFTYIGQLVKTLASYQEPEVQFRVDNQTHSAHLFSLLAGICKYAGNAMKLVPQANPSDGLFHLTIASKISRLKVILNLPRLFSGSFTQLKEVKSLTCTEIEIQTSGLPIQADGESIGHTPAIFVVHPLKLHIVIAP